MSSHYADVRRTGDAVERRLSIDDVQPCVSSSEAAQGVRLASKAGKRVFWRFCRGRAVPLWLLLAAVFVALLVTAGGYATWQYSRLLHQFPLTGRGKTHTKIPMYYMNLGRSTTRRQHMEETFGHWGELNRIEAVDGSDAETVRANVQLNGLTFAQYVDAARVNSIGEIAICTSAMHAVQTAYERGNRYMLLLEDDMSDILAPFWTLSLDEVAMQADELHPDWDVIQLHAIAYGVQREIFSAWKANPSNPFVARGEKLRIWGGGAEMFSRRGMERFLKLFRTESGKFDCLSVTRNDPTFKCLADYLYWKIPQPWEALLRMPPMFTYQLNEGSTRVRLDSNQTEESDSKESDKFVGHYQSIMDGLRANIEAQAAHNAPHEFGDDSLETGELRYMQIDAMQLNALKNNTGTKL